MEYHSDRFLDHSLFFYRGNELVALLPANLANHVLYSHGGLTFGGLITRLDMSQTTMLDIFNQLIEHCKNNGITQVIYKPVPHVYHSYPAEEDLYALYRNNAHLVSRNVASAIYVAKERGMKTLRRRTIKKAQKEGLLVKQCSDLKRFMEISQDILKERHETKPVHSTEEIEYLAAKFPSNIKLFGSYKGNEMLAGVIMFEYNHVAHAQYAANSDQGWIYGAEDLIFDYLINHYYKDSMFFDFGISNEKIAHVLLDKVLNEGLINYKEGFGASTIVYDQYMLPIASSEG